MKIISGALAALVLGGIALMPPANAQGVPQGSYARSCTNVGVQGDSLTATCRRTDGREQSSVLAGFRRCTGDIGNSNGILQCNLQGGGQAHGQVVQGTNVPMTGPSSPTYGTPPAPGYGAPQPQGYGAQPTPSYGAPTMR